MCLCCVPLGKIEHIKSATKSGGGIKGLEKKMGWSYRGLSIEGRLKPSAHYDYRVLLLIHLKKVFKNWGRQSDRQMEKQHNGSGWSA